MYAAVHIVGPHKVSTEPVSGPGRSPQSLGLQDGGDGMDVSPLVQLADAFSPKVEQFSAETVVFDIDGLRRMFGGPHQIASEIAHRADSMGLRGNIGIAATVDSAILAARNYRGVLVIPPGEEVELLGDLPVSALPITAEMGVLLHRWGIRTIGEFCALPEGGVLERLGVEGRRMLRVARGEFQRPLRVMQDPVNYCERMPLDHSVQLLEPLLFLISRLLHELCTRLKSHARATSEIELVFEMEGGDTHERHMQIPFATHEAITWLKLIQLDLESSSPSKPVTSISLRVIPVDPRVVQHNLYAPVTPQPEKLELTLGKIRAMVGVDNVGFPEVLNTHRPDAYRMRPSVMGKSFSSTRLRNPARVRTRTSVLNHTDAAATSIRLPEPAPIPLSFRYFRPAREASIDLVHGTPQHVRSKGISGAVQSAAGPWKLSGDWWSADSWVRMEWDVALSNRVLYRIYFCRERWYLEGAYD